MNVYANSSTATVNCEFHFRPVWVHNLISCQSQSGRKSYVERTCMFGGEHDHKGLSDKGVRPTRLAAVVIGIVFSHRHSVFPGEGKQPLNIMLDILNEFKTEF